MNTRARTLLYEARSAMILTQSMIGEITGTSRRTVQRWDAGTSHPGVDSYRRLAAAVYPANPELAERFAEAGGTTVEALGLVPPAAPPEPPPAPAPPAPPPPPPPTYDAAHLADSVVCAAARAIALPPDAVKPALFAAFARTKAMGLGLDAMVAALAPVAVKPAPSKQRQ